MSDTPVKTRAESTDTIRGADQTHETLRDCALSSIRESHANSIQPDLSKNTADTHLPEVKIEWHAPLPSPVTFKDVLTKLQDSAEAAKMATAIEQGGKLSDKDEYLKDLAKEGKTTEIEEIIKMTNKDLEQDGSNLQLDLSLSMTSMGGEGNGSIHNNLCIEPKQQYDLKLTDGQKTISEDRFRGEFEVGPGPDIPQIWNDFNSEHHQLHQAK